METVGVGGAPLLGGGSGGSGSGGQKKKESRFLKIIREQKNTDHNDEEIPVKYRPKDHGDNSMKVMGRNFVLREPFVAYPVVDNTFLVIRLSHLYKGVCLSIGRSVGRSKNLLENHHFRMRLLHLYKWVGFSIHLLVFLSIALSVPL